MDFTGTRRQARETSSLFFEEIAEALIANLQGESLPAVHDKQSTRDWRAGGYILASYLFPQKRRYPEELGAFIAGMRQRMEEYETEGPIALAAPSFDIEACERLEAKAQKYLSLATHKGTRIEEARNAAMQFAKLAASSDIVVLGWERVRHLGHRLAQLEQTFAMLRLEHPNLFLWGDQSREQER